MAVRSADCKVNPRSALGDPLLFAPGARNGENPEETEIDADVMAAVDLFLRGCGYRQNAA